MHTFTKKLTFTPLTKKRYRCNQTGEVMTQARILGFVANILAGGSGTSVSRSTEKKSPPKKKWSNNRSSKYRAKQRGTGR